MNLKGIFAILLVNFGIFTTIEGIRCYYCQNVDSPSKCRRKVRCRNAADGCANQVRLENGILRITKGCQQRQACISSSRQNRFQCTPVVRNVLKSNNFVKQSRSLPPSVCRSCCSKDSCNGPLFLQEATSSSAGSTARWRSLKPTITDVKVTLLTPSTALITFVDIQNHPANFHTVRLYPYSRRVKVSPVYLRSNSIGGRRVDYSERSLAYLARGLSAGARYRINVLSRRGKRLYSQRIFTSFVTKPRPPSSIAVVEGGTGSLTLRVRKPRYQTGDRPVSYYSLSYRKVLDPPSQAKRIANFRRLDLKVIRGLEPATKYIIEAWTNSRLTNGRTTLRSSKINITAVTDVPPVERVDVAKLHATNITWAFRVPRTIPSGSQEEFVVVVRDNTNQRIIVDTVIPGSKRTFTATNLRTQNAYSVTVRARTRGHVSKATRAPPVFTHVRCYGCVDSSSPLTCNQFIECPADAGGCLNEVRRRSFTSASESGWYRVTMKCKQVKACNSSEEQDHTMQCNPNRDRNVDPPEVCRCCCEGDLCNGPSGKCGHVLGWLTPFRSPQIQRDSIAPFCPLPTFSFGEFNCSNSNEVGSVCRFHCSGDRYLVGEGKVTCLDHGRWSDEFPTCQPLKSCPAIPPSEGTTYNCSKGVKGGSVCRASCDDDYLIAGEEMIKCLPSGKWSHLYYPICLRIDNCQPDPCQNGAKCHDGIEDFECDCTPGWTGKVCDREVVCENLTIPENGKLECTKGNRYLSRCRYSCNYGYKQHGSSYTRCLTDGYWSAYEPTVCVHNMCEVPPLRLVNYGKTVCNGYVVGDSCHFTCPNSLSVIGGPPNITCMPNKQWSSDVPCCDLPCPPHAKVDLYILLDSSSSVGLQNWNILVNFTVSLLSQFVLGPDDMVVGVGRYNHDFDRNSEISFGEYENFEDLETKIRALPYDGYGTRTGAALRYIARNSLRSPANRQGVPDIVVVITDGVSLDSVAFSSRFLKRNKDLKVYSIGVRNRKNDLSLAQLKTIASGDKYMHIMDGGYEQLVREFTPVLASDVCSVPCQAKYEKQEIFLRERQLAALTGDAVDEEFWKLVDTNYTVPVTKTVTTTTQPATEVQPSPEVGISEVVRPPPEVGVPEEAQPPPEMGGSEESQPPPEESQPPPEEGGPEESQPPSIRPTIPAEPARDENARPEEIREE